MGSDAVFQSMKQNLMEMHGSVIEKLQITFNMHNNKHRLRNNQKVMAAKLIELNSHIKISCHIVAESCTYLSFLLI
jgi:hypothetical protein